MTHYRLTTLFALLSTLWLGLGIAGETKIEDCLECHFADDFEGEAVEDIATLIRNNAAADSEHPADLSGLSEAEIAEIAAYLSRGGD